MSSRAAWSPPVLDEALLVAVVGDRVAPREEHQRVRELDPLEVLGLALPRAPRGTSRRDPCRGCRGRWAAGRRCCRRRCTSRPWRRSRRARRPALPFGEVDCPAAGTRSRAWPAACRRWCTRTSPPGCRRRPHRRRRSRRSRRPWPRRGSSGTNCLPELEVDVLDGVDPEAVDAEVDPLLVDVAHPLDDLGPLGEQVVQADEVAVRRALTGEGRVTPVVVQRRVVEPGRGLAVSSSSVEEGRVRERASPGPSPGRSCRRSHGRRRPCRRRPRRGRPSSRCRL